MLSISWGDWIRAATTRPPELNFTFSDKFNELHFNVFAYISMSFDLSLSGVVAISRVPPVFHASFTTRSKLKSGIPDIRKCRGLFIRTTDPKFLFQITGLDAHDLSVAHDNQFAVLLLRLFNQTLTASKIPALIFSCFV